MAKQLEQESIDAMFAAMQVGENVADGGEESAGIEAYNFGRAGQINNEQMRAIGGVNNLFARNLMDTLGGWLRTEFDVRLVAGEQLPYGEFVERLTKPMYVCSIVLEPFDALGLMELDLMLALPMLDLLLGGAGGAGTARAVTDIEETILANVVERIVQELNVAWKPFGLEMAMQRREGEEQVERIMTSQEKTLCVSFEVRMPGTQGMINLCFPASVLNAILRRMVAESGRPRRRAGEARNRMRELMGETMVGAVLQFPPMKLRARELAALTPGSVLRLPLPRHADAELRVSGLCLGRAQPVRTGEHRGAQLEAGVGRGTALILGGA